MMEDLWIVHSSYLACTVKRPNFSDSILLLALRRIISMLPQTELDAFSLKVFQDTKHKSSFRCSRFRTE